MSELLEEVSHRMQCLVVLRGDGDMAVGWIEAPCDRETESPHGQDLKMGALVVICCWSNVVTISGVQHP